MTSLLLHRIALTLALGTSSLPAPLQLDLTGRWVREGPARPGLEDQEPAWEEIAIVADTVTIRRATRPSQTEVYRFDSTERQIMRTRQTRYCRTEWSDGALIVECRETDGGPGGGAPPIWTREVRSLNASGRLVIETTWRSGDQTVTRRALFRRDVP
jgi:hypothetical protein